MQTASKSAERLACLEVVGEPIKRSKAITSAFSTLVSVRMSAQAAHAEAYAKSCAFHRCIGREGHGTRKGILRIRPSHRGRLCWRCAN
eukprot:6208990-Pleurochrysis_carterae.AAC.1